MKKGDDKKMKNKFVLIRYVLMLWLLCGAGHTASFASAYERNASSQGWGYQPLQSVRGASNYAVSYGEISSAVQPSYRFHTTSAYINSSDYDAQSVWRPTGKRRIEGWGDPDEEDPIGSVKPTPVGEPIILLAFALLYLAIGLFRRRKPSADC